jgi:maltodextrin utilization protein YvdJ
MKLNDPFGRMERRHQAGYEMMRTALRNAGIETAEQAEDAIRQSWKRGYKIMGVGMLLLLVVLVLFPTAAPLILALGVVMVVWVVSSNLSGQRYIKRYIDEDLKQG